MSKPIAYLSRLRQTPALLAVLCSAQLLFATIADGQSEGPFVKMLGAWRGSGKISMTNGNSERIRCTATYSDGSGGSSISQALVCASDSYHVDVHTYIEATGQNVRGHWEESVQQAAGQLAGQILEGQFEGKILGNGFEATLSLITTGSRQTISVTPQGGNISRIQIALSRGG
jgi:hypothetical protein